MYPCENSGRATHYSNESELLKARIIPTLLWKDSGLVKGVAFDSWRRVGTLLPAIKVYNTREVDELILLDITATEERRAPDFATVEDISAECFVPLTVGGGIRSLDDIRQLLLAGADKICLNSAAYEHPNLVRDAAHLFGSQCIVASIDARKNSADGHECFSHCGRRPTGRTPATWAAELEHLGAGEILITSIECDGTLSGFDLDLIRQVTSRVSIPVIASGGCGTYEHMLLALREAGASAVAAASLFHFTEQTPKEAKAYLHRHGLPVRGSGAMP